MGKGQTENVLLDLERFKNNLLFLAQGKLSFLVAYSGGADSTALCCLLSLIKTSLASDILVVHVNHNLRDPKEIEEELSLVRRNCHLFSLPLRIVTVKPGLIRDLAHKRRMGLEEAARFVRQSILIHEKKRTKADWILTAHHQDDQAETMIMRLFHGAGLQMLTGIREKTDHFLRPLIHLPRQALLDFLQNKKIDYSTDSTNGDGSNLRSVLRMKIIPVLQGVFPRYAGHLDRLGTTLQEYSDENELRLKPYLRITGRKAVFDVRGAHGREETFCRAVRACLRAIGGSGQRYQRKFINYLFKCVNEKKKTRVSHKNCLLEFEFPLMTFAPKVANIEKTLYFISIDSPGRVECKKLLEVQFGTEESGSGNISIPGASFPMVLRSPAPGDGIRLKSFTGSVKKILQDWKVPREIRPQILVLEDRNGIKALLGGYCGYRDIIYYNGEPEKSSGTIWIKVSRWSELK